jgi:CRP/FNR family cyclic AMP-dependent transcriptional regulator
MDTSTQKPVTSSTSLRLVATQSAPPPVQFEPSELDSLIGMGVQRSYRRGALILNQGESGDAMYFLLKGRVRAFDSGPTGKEITYGTIEAGEYFGEMALDGGSRSASVEALEPCVCSVVSNAQVMAFMRDHSNFAVQLLHTLTERARLATDAARDMALLDVYTRLAQTLNRLAVPAPKQADIRIIETTMTHAELAAYVGASREMVSKLMKDLERGGYMQVESRRIMLMKKLPARW